MAPRVTYQEMQTADLVGRKWKRNPRTISPPAFDGLVASIERWGLVQPIVYNTRTDRVVGGHQRLDALVAAIDHLQEQLDHPDTDKATRKVLGAQLAEYQTTQVVIVDLPDDDEAALNVALNNPAIAGEFTPEVEAILEQIKESNEALLQQLRLDKIKLPSPPRETLPAPDLADRFGAPPFSILDARQGYWRERKAMWQGLGYDPAAGKHHLPTTTNKSNADEGHFMAGVGATSGGSHFDPVLVELVLRWFCPGGGHVLDPMCGGPTAGVVAGVLGYPFTGVDWRGAQPDANLQQWAVVRRKLDQLYADPRWIHGDAGNLARLFIDQDAFDMVLIDPPYYTLERYDAGAKLWDTPAAYLDWLIGIIEGAARRLRQDRFLVVKIGDVRKPSGSYCGIPERVVDRIDARQNQLQLYNRAFLIMELGTLPVRVAKQFLRSRKLGKAHQDLLVFWKGDPKQAAAVFGAEQVDADLSAFSDERD